MSNITVVVMTEFGRRAYENASVGTDHGFGSVMWLMSGNMNGGQVLADWPGLSNEALNEGDLEVTTDYRSVLNELLKARLGNTNTDLVFPDFVDPGGPGLFV